MQVSGASEAVLQAANRAGYQALWVQDAPRLTWPRTLATQQAQHLCSERDTLAQTPSHTQRTALIYTQSRQARPADRSVDTMQALARGARRGLNRGSLLSRVMVSSSSSDPSPAEQHASAADNKNQALLRDFQVYRRATQPSQLSPACSAVT